MRPLIRSCLLLALALPVTGCGLSSWDGSMGSLFSTPSAASGLVDRSPEAIYAAGIEALQARRYPQAVELFDALEREHP